MVAAGSADGASAATVLQLLELGASASPGPGLSPLAYACAGLGWNYPPGGDADRAVLLAAGADPGTTLPNGASALACAARGGEPERVRLLLDAGADPMPDCILERAGYPVLLPFRDPLLMAAASGSAACVRLLLDGGADLRRYPDGEEQPLVVAGSLEVVAALLAAGADPRHDQGGRRTVVESVARNPAGLALIRHGVSFDIEYPETGFRPHHAAAAATCSGVLLALLEAGASPIETSADGRTPLDIARDARALACIDLLERAVAQGA